MTDGRDRRTSAPMVDLTFPPIMFASSPSTSRTSSSTPSGGSMARNFAANWHACDRLHSKETAPFQAPSRYTADVTRSFDVYDESSEAWTSMPSIVEKMDCTICTTSSKFSSVFISSFTWRRKRSHLQFCVVQNIRRGPESSRPRQEEAIHL